MKDRKGISAVSSSSAAALALWGLYEHWGVTGEKASCSDTQGI